MPQKLSYGDFLLSFKLAPRVAIELLVENEDHELLLLKRETEPFAGEWHVPGGFLLKDEKIDDCIERIASDELGLNTNAKNFEKLSLFENREGDPRGHILHYPVKVVLPKIEGKDYFSKLPQNTIFYQMSFLKKLGYKEE